MAETRTLKLDRGLSSPAFSSWRLDPSADLQPEQHRLPGRVATVLAGGEGFLQTKTVLQQNHLHEQPRGTYVFLRQDQQQPPALHRVEYKDDAAGIATTRLTGPLDGGAGAEAAGGLLELRLPGSLAEVRGCDAAAGDGAAAHRLLVSSGHGDLRLVSQAAAAGTADPPPVYPLQAPVPQQGVRTFLIEAACEAPAGGKVQCIVSALRSKRAGAPAACEVFAITLTQPPEAAASLQVDDVQLLQVSAARPYAVVPAPAQQLVLLAVEPSKLPRPGAAAAEAAQQAAAAIGAPSAAEEFDANPRTLQQAVDNLARFTSDKSAEGPISERLADIDSEAGPGGEGALGGEPEVALLLLSLGGAADGPVAPAEVDRIACGAHRLLGPSSGGSGGESVLLGLTDKVDAAVLRAGIGSDGRIAAEHVATVPALAYVAAGKVQRRAVLFGQPGADAAAVIVETHAYAYIYKAMAPKATSGKNVVVPLRLGMETMGVLGMRILTAVSGSCGSRAMLLTEDSVITLPL